eukprot:4774407-Pyramimonas_sp.AAC.1
MEREGAGPLLEEGESMIDPKWTRRSYFGAHKQKDGNNFVGVNVPVGRLQADDMLALAHLAETYGAFFEFFVFFPPHPALSSFRSE